jgi:hypothetical protein
MFNVPKREEGALFVILQAPHRIKRSVTETIIDEYVLLLYYCIQTSTFPPMTHKRKWRCYGLVKMMKEKGKVFRYL